MFCLLLGVGPDGTKGAKEVDMRQTWNGFFVGLVAASASLGWGGTAMAGNSIRVGAVVIQPGATRVVVPIEATTEDPLTLLSVDASFDRSLCDQVAGIEVAAAGRTHAEFQEGGSRCPQEGRIRMVAIDLSGGAVIPPGDGVIANLELDVLPGASGHFPLALSVNQASNGPVAIALVPSAGESVRGVVAACAGDCDGDGVISVAELIAAVNIALADGPVTQCSAVDQNGDGVVSVDELVGAVQSGLSGCAAG
jgi:hypothetical protein